MTMTNNDVAMFSGTNQELCEQLGKFASHDSPAHFYNYSAKSLRDHAKIKVADGKGDEIFEINKSRRKSQSQSQTPSAVYALHGKISAVLPALSLKFGEPDVKGLILKTSKPASACADAELSNDVKGFLSFFGIDDNESYTSLLSYAGVKTMRRIKIDRVSDAIKILAAMNLQSLTNDRLEDLERLLLSFALTGEVSETE